MKALLFAGLLLPSLSSGQGIRIAFHNGATTVNGMTTRPAGSLVNTGLDTWNNIQNNGTGGVGLTFTNSTINLDNGSPSGATLSVSANSSSFGSGAWGSNSQDWVVMEGYYTFTTASTLTLSNLPASLTSGGYIITIYGDSADGRTMNFYLDDGLATPTVTLNDTAGIFSGNFVQGVNFNSSPVLSGSSLAITFNTATNGQAGKLSLIQGMTLIPAGPATQAARHATASGYWEQIPWSTGTATTTGGVGDDDSILVGRYHTVTYRGIPAMEVMGMLNLGETSANPGQGTLFVESGSLRVSNNLSVGRNASANDAFLHLKGGTMRVDGNAVFGRDAAYTDGSLIMAGGTFEVGGNLAMGAFLQGGSMLRLHNPGSSPPVQVGGTLTLGRCSLDLTFDGGYSHLPGTVTTVVNYGARSGQFLNFRHGDEFNCGPNRFRIDYDATPGAITLTALPNLPKSPARPNIILILADDQGYADTSLTGSSQFPMPNLDALAASGVRFTDAYVSGGVCHPTRCGLLTGRYQQRTGNESNLAAPSYNGMAVSQRTIPRRLQSLGYKTYGIGKWHLGDTVEFHPNCRGFDRWYGMWTGSRSYYDSPTETGVFQNQMIPDFAAENTGYLTDRIGDSAVDMIDEHLANAAPDEPFFIFMSFTAVHAPMDIKSLDPRFARLQSEFGITAATFQNSPFIHDGSTQATVDANRYELAAMTLALDENIGKVMTKLADEEIADNTLIVYLNDNGGAGWSAQHSGNFSYNDPLNGFKGATALEGSLRVPCAAKWPAVIPAGQVVTEPIIALDWGATFVNAADDAPASVRNGLDGLDLLPRLTGTAPLPADRVLAWRANGTISGGSAARMGDWKLRYDDPDPEPKLYHIRSDIGETTNVAAANPAIVAELAKHFRSWEARTLPPLYNGGGTSLDAGLARWAIPGGLLLQTTSSTPLWQSAPLRQPLSLASNFAFSFLLRPSEPGPYAPGAGLWQGLGDSTNRGQLIRMGVDFANSALTLVEGKTGNSASVALPTLPTAFSTAQLRYHASTGVLSLCIGTSTVSLTLNGSYGPLGYAAMGASAMEGEITTLRAGGQETSAIIMPVPAGNIGLRLDVGSEPAFDPVLERSTSLSGFTADPGALVESLGGGLYQVTLSSAPPGREFYRFRFDRR